MGDKRVAILGGSFNPPHIAHEMACKWVLDTRKADRVWMVPCYEHIFGKHLLSFEHRMEMCKLAAQSFPNGQVQVSSIEKTIGGKSRTLITLEHLIAQYPDIQFILLIGADILQEKDRWYRFDEIEKKVDILVVGRSGYPSPRDAPILPAISASEIRKKIAKGQDVSNSVPLSVLKYIFEHQLYEKYEEQDEHSA